MTSIIILFMMKTMITGASSGIGRTYAERFAARGHGLPGFWSHVRPAAAPKTPRRAALGKTVKVEVLQADLTNSDDLARVAKKLETDKGIEILVNNAGATSEQGFAAQDHEPLFAIVDLNIVALTRLASSAVKGFRASGKRGAIINLGSIVGLAPEFFPGVYGATKAYVQALSQAMRHELGDAGPYIQNVLPAATRTEIWERSGRDVNAIPG